MTPRTLRTVLSAGGARAAVDLALAAGRLTGAVASRRVEAEVERRADGALVLRRDGRTVVARAVRSRGRWLLAIEGCTFEVAKEEPGAKRPASAGHEPFAASPMTGLVAKVAVVPGQAVAAGATLFVVEAMKMEYAVKAPRAVTVAEVRRQAGQKVTLGEVVVTFAEAP